MTLSRQISASGRYFGVAAIVPIVLSASPSEAGVKRFTTGMVEVPEGSGIRIYLHNTGTKDATYSVTIAAPNVQNFAFNLLTSLCRPAVANGGTAIQPDDERPTSRVMSTRSSEKTGSAAYHPPRAYHGPPFGALFDDVDGVIRGSVIGSPLQPATPWCGYGASKPCCPRTHHTPVALLFGRPVNVTPVARVTA